MKIKRFDGICTRDVNFDLESRAGEDGGDGRTLSGYAAVFDTDTEINSYEGHFTERVSPGAFKKTLNERKNVLMQYDHGRDVRVGSTPIGAYTTIREDAKGLYVEGRLFDNDLVEPVRQAIEGGAITGMSFKFKVTRDVWHDKNGKEVKGDEKYRLMYEPGNRGPLQRTIKEVALYEAGPVASPAYASTSVGVRSSDLEPEERDALIAQHRALNGDEPEHDLAAWIHAERCWKSKALGRFDLYPAQVDGDIEKVYHNGRRLTDDELRTIREWVEAEKNYTCRWLEAETEFKNSQDDAGKSTSSANPDNAVRSDTLRDSQKDKLPKKRIHAMTLAELRARLAEIDVRNDELDDVVRSGTELTDAEEREQGALTEERKQVEARIAKIEKRMEELAGKATDGKTDRSSGPAFHKSVDPFDLDALRRDTNPGEEYRAKVEEYAYRAIEKAEYGGTEEIKGQEPAENVERALKIAKGEDNAEFAERILRTGSEVYARAFAKAVAKTSVAQLTEEEARALSLGADSGGGYAVPFQLDPSVIYTSTGVINPLRGISRNVKITGKEWQGLDSAGTTVTRKAEAAEADDNSFSINQKVLRVNAVRGFIPFSHEIDLTWGAVQAEITRALIDAKDHEEAASFTNGNGTGLNAGGVLGSLTGNTVNASTGQTFTAADVYKLEEALDARYQANAKFLGHKVIYNKIRQFDTAGGAQLWERIGNKTPDQLLGYDALRTTEMASVHTTGSKFLLFGDFQNFLILDRIGMSVDLVPHLFGPNGRPTNQRGIHAVWMNNSKVLVHNAFKVLIGVA